MKGYIWNEQAETMPYEQLRELQGRRLADCVRRMYGKVPYYTEKMKAAGIAAGRHPVPWTTWPSCHSPIRKTCARTTPTALLPSRSRRLSAIHASSGTTGKQKVVGYTRNDIDMWSECCCRSLASTGMTNKDILHVAYGYGLFTGGLGLHYGAEKLGATTIPVSSGNTKRQIQILVDFQPTALACTPSYALHLADEMADLRRRQVDAQPQGRHFRRRTLDTGHEAADRGKTGPAGPSISTACPKPWDPAFRSAAKPATCCISSRIISSPKSSIRKPSSRCRKAKSANWSFPA